MALRLSHRERDAAYVLDWLRPTRAVFMQSEAARLFRATLLRYVSGEATGRAILVSGYRGSGKTTMVSRVVQDVAEAAVDDLKLIVEAGGDAARAGLLKHGLKRPLLVRLHGPSLMAPPDPQGASAKAEPNAEKQSAAASKTEAAKPEKTGEKADPPPQPKAKDDDRSDDSALRAQAALKRVTIALYRALADEFAEAYANQARAARQNRETLYETAGQFRLDLDGATGMIPDILNRDDC